MNMQISPKPKVAIDVAVEAGAPSRKAVYTRRHLEKAAAQATAEGPLDFVVTPSSSAIPKSPSCPSIHPSCPFDSEFVTFENFYVLKVFNRGADCLWLAMLSVNGNILVVDLHRVALVRGSDAWRFRGVVTAALVAPFRVDVRLLLPQSVASPFPIVHSRLVDSLLDEIRQKFVLTLRFRLKCSGCNKTSMSEDQLTYVTVSNRNDDYKGSIPEMLAATEGVTKVADCAGCGAQTTHSIDRMKIKTPPPKVLVVHIKPTQVAHAMVKPPPFFRERIGQAKYALKHVITSSLDQEAKNALNGQPVPAPYTHAIALHNVGGKHGWVRTWLAKASNVTLVPVTHPA